MIAAVLSVALAVAPVQPYVISGDGGGLIDSYVLHYKALAASGVPVKIAGDCISACTLVLSLPSSQVCAEPQARLGFHFATNRQGEVMPDMTRRLANEFYPPAVRRWFLKLRMKPGNAPYFRKATSVGVRPCE